MTTSQKLETLYSSRIASLEELDYLLDRLHRTKAIHEANYLSERIAKLNSAVDDLDRKIDAMEDLLHDEQIERDLDSQPGCACGDCTKFRLPEGWSHNDRLSHEKFIFESGF